jgi:NAD(P)H-hydrate epimerase
MLKILNTKQIKALDAYTIIQEPVTSIDLMERACRVFVTWFAEKFESSKKIGIVCGTGNNGGDGLAIARVLFDRNYVVKVWVVRGAMPESEDFKTNLKRLQSNVKTWDIISEADPGLFTGCDILIDGIVGSGLSRPTEGIYEQVISCLNNADATRLAIDIPSGLMADSRSSGAIVKAHYTLSFHLPKLAFFLPENYKYVGQWHLVAIGLNKEFIANETTSYYLLEKKDIVKLKKTRSKFSHKGNYGRALLIAGSYGKVGAVVLAAKAAMRAGTGLVTVHVPQCGYSILQTAAPEAMVSVDSHEKIITKAVNVDSYDAVGVGPGMGTDPETVKAVAELLANSRIPLVIDADGLNILAANRELLHLIPVNSILTPHPKEFERLAGGWKNDFERLEKLSAFSKQINVIVILKGAFTTIALPNGNVFFNSTGNPGMATGGSGDVLTGILTGLLAQQYTAIEAAQLGVYLHGQSGDLAVREKGMESLIASDIIDFLPKAFESLSS